MLVVPYFWLLGAHLTWSKWDIVCCYVMMLLQVLMIRCLFTLYCHSVVLFCTVAAVRSDTFHFNFECMYFVTKNYGYMSVLISDNSLPTVKLLHKAWSRMCCCWMFCRSVSLSKRLHWRRNCFWGTSANRRKGLQVQLLPGLPCEDICKILAQISLQISGYIELN